MKPTVLIHRDSVTNLFVAECPETGIASQGKTEVEALENLREATELYLGAFARTAEASGSNRRSKEPLATQLAEVFVMDDAKWGLGGKD